MLRGLFFLGLFMFLTPTASAQFRIRQVAPLASQPVSITLASWPSSVEDVPASEVIVTATGGTAPYSCALTSGALPAGITETAECHYNGTPSTPGTYTFTITVTDTIGGSGHFASQSYSPTITISGASLPPQWSQTDIGSGQCLGNASYASPFYNTEGCGTTYNTSDKLHYVYQAVSGNYQIVAEVTALSNDSGLLGYAQAGVMVRTSLASNGSNVYAFDNGVQPIGQWRLTDGGSTSSDVGVSARRAWYRLQVIGTAVTMDYSSDGSTWTTINSAKTLPISGTYYIGLAVNSNFDADTAYGTFNNVTVSTIIGGSGTVTDLGGYRPHYRGYGADTCGAFCGPTPPVVCRVTSTSASLGSLTTNGDGTRSGTFRACFALSVPVVIVFETSGTWNGLRNGSVLYRSDPYITVAGQTAPRCNEGSGATGCASGVGGVTFVNSKIVFNSYQFVIQHVRMRENESGGSTTFDCILCLGDGGSGVAQPQVQNGVLDHVSLALAGGGTPMTYTAVAVGNILITDSLYGWGVDAGTSTDGGYNFGIEGNQDQDNCKWSFTRNFMGDTWGRSPTVGASCHANVSNSIAYGGVDNSPGSSHYGFFSFTHRPNGFQSSIPGSHVYTYNIMKPGPNSGSPDGFIAVSVNAIMLSGTELYLNGNYGTGVTGTSGNGQWTGMIAYNQNVTGGAGDINYATQGIGSNIRINTPPTWWTAKSFVEITDSQAAISNAVVATAGAFPDSQNRDAIDTRVLADYVNGTGTWHMSVPAYTSLYGSLPTVVTRTRAFTLPSNPNSAGSCGFSRTVLQCYLENDIEFGAQRLEPFQGVP